MEQLAVKSQQKRGQLTERIKAKSVELFGYEISQKELRLMPYILYEAQNNKKANNVNEEEQKVLSSWIDRGFLLITGLGNILSMSEDFWNKAHQIIFLGYVDLSE